MTVTTNAIPKGSDVWCDKPDLLHIIEEDDAEKFAAYGDRSRLTASMSFCGEDCPWILADDPPISCVCAFFGAKACFKHLAINVIHDFRWETDEQERNIGHFAVAGGCLDIIRTINERDTTRDEPPESESEEEDSYSYDGRYHDSWDDRFRPQRKRPGGIFAQVDAKGYTCAHYAAKFGKLEALQWLWMQGTFDLDVTTGSGATPLMWACSNGHVDVAKFLVESGACIRASTYGGWSALHYAAAKNQAQAAEYILTVAPDAMDAIRRNCGPPVRTAIENGAVDVVKVLVEHGCSLLTGFSGACAWGVLQNPIVFDALAQRRFEIVRYLAGLEKLWQVLDVNQIYSLILSASEISGQESLVLEMKNQAKKAGKVNDEALEAIQKFPNLIRMRATRENVLSVCKKENIPVNYVDRDGATFLHKAAQENNLEIVKLLVELGADINKKGRGETPLSLAIRKNARYVAEYLAGLPQLDMTQTFGGRTYFALCCPRNGPKQSMKTAYSILMNRAKALPQ